MIAFSSAGCSPPSEPTGDPAYDVFLTATIARAEDGGADESQITLLESTRGGTQLSLSTTMEAINATFACFDEAGIQYSIQQRGSEADFTPPTYIFRDDGDAMTEIADDCMQRNSFFVEAAFQGQPMAVAARRAVFEQKLPEIIACLQDQGETLPDEATADEVLAIVKQPSTEWTEQITQGLPIPPDCMTRAGINIIE